MEGGIGGFLHLLMTERTRVTSAGESRAVTSEGERHHRGGRQPCRPFCFVNKEKQDHVCNQAIQLFADMFYFHTSLSLGISVCINPQSESSFQTLSIFFKYLNYPCSPC